MPGMAPQDPYTYPGNLSGALQLIHGAVAGEREDELFYDYLISIAPSEEDKKIISSIRDDERKHFKLFRQIYLELTGQMLPPAQDTEFERPKSYCAGIQKALFGELGAVERYRKILFALQDRRQINMLTEIITDEIKHSSKYNFLYSRNQCYEK
ncbi:MAG: ferritin-like domain-containing protein [Clostridiales bacterium]|nr:ferritin-like domain-containing protein [Eubacteriales bacterium]MDH7566644.1 ferritin-like domain-containing protein [Clostridiales bacterium]